MREEVDVQLNPGSSAGDDVARQTITTMSTLVVAIAAFYFGTCAVQQVFTATSATAATGTTDSLEVLAPKTIPVGCAARRATAGSRPACR